MSKTGKPSELGTLENPFRRCSIKNKYSSSINKEILAVVSAKHWFGDSTGNLGHFTVYKDFYIVATWSELNCIVDETKVKSVLEAKTTIAMCKELKDAELIFENF